MKKCAWLLSFLLSCVGCAAKEEAPEPTEPWPAGQAPKIGATREVVAAPDATSKKPLVFDVSHESPFRLRLPAKEATPTGTVSGLGGSFTVDPDHLESTRGTVLFDLSTLTIHGDGGSADAQRSEWGRSWLGLGKDVPSATRSKLRYGRFEVDAVHDLSVPRLERSKSKGPRRQQVRGHAAGRLVIRNLAVARRVPIEVTFQWPEEAGSGPNKIVVRLLTHESVPLAEHRVTPRESNGEDQPADLSLLGRVVGKTVLVDGEIALLPRPL